jgi:hypothetical protein
MLIANAARLAQAYDAELVGIFVKVQDYINLAELPFTQTVMAPTGRIRPLDKSSMEKALNDMAARAKKGLSEQALSRKLRWSFQVHTGYAEDVVTANTTSTDILSLSGVAYPAIRKATERHQLPAMVITHLGQTGKRPVMVVYEGQAATLAVGRRIAASLGVNMSVLLVPEHAADSARYRANAKAWLRRNHASATIDLLDHGGREAVMRRLAISRPGLVVASCSGAIGGQMRNSLEGEESNTPLLLIDNPS